MEAAKGRLFSSVEDRNLRGLQSVLHSMGAKNGERAELINSVDNVGRTILHFAAANKDRPMIRWILSDSGGRAAGFNRVLAKTGGGETALHISAARGNFALFFAIIMGCKVENGERAEMLNAVSGNGRTVLHCAARRGSDDIVNWFLSEKAREAGFNPDNLFALTSMNQSVLHLAASPSSISVECLDLILRQCRNAEERWRLLFGVDNSGWTLLHFAASSERLPIVEWVVSRQQEERGGSNEDLFALTNDRESVLHIAAWGGSVEVFDFLLSHCNNTSERLRLFLGRDNKGRTIFFHAAQGGLSWVISHVLRKYPEESKMIIDARDHRGMTVLHRVIIAGLDEESREEWGVWQSDNGKRAIVAALLGFEDVDKQDVGDQGKRSAETDIVAMGDDEDDDKKPIEDKKEVTAAGADPNLGLKFE